MKKIYSLAFALLFFFHFTKAQSLSNFINEVNYLASNPAARGFEIAGEAGSSLAGWTAVLYNANGTVSSIKDLGSLIIPDLQNGFGAIWYDVDQTLTGGGLALVKPDGSVAQFVSYGPAGNITATEGNANGLTSDFIGFQLLSSHSLQLIGTGIAYLDFLWALPGWASRGQVNVSQFFGWLLPPLFLEGNNSLPNAVGEGQAEVLPTVSPATTMELTLYPNPVVDQLFIRRDNYADPAQTVVQLFDANGRLMEQVQLQESETTIDLGHFPSGHYLVKAGGFSRIVMKQ